MCVAVTIFLNNNDGHKPPDVVNAIQAVKVVKDKPTQSCSLALGTAALGTIALNAPGQHGLCSERLLYL